VLFILLEVDNVNYDIIIIPLFNYLLFFDLLFIIYYLLFIIYYLLINTLFIIYYLLLNTLFIIYYLLFIIY